VELVVGFMWNIHTNKEIIKEGTHIAKISSNDTLKYTYEDYSVLLFNTYSKTEKVDEPIGKYLKLLKRGKVVFSLENFTNLYPVILYFGKDITGDGYKNAVISNYTMGAHCCFELYIFELGNNFRKIYYYNGDAEPVMQDIDKDGIMEIVTLSDIFSYWHNSYATSYFPEYILKYKNGMYHLALNLMKKPVPQKDTLNKWSEEIKWNRIPWNSDESQIALDPLFLERVIEMIFTGNSKIAMEFIKTNWPKSKNGKELFIKDFMTQLSKFQYWSEMKDW
jgi:hypothetical protein